MHLTVVGCSGSFAGPDSAASCYLLTETDADGRTWNVVLDLGSGALGALQRYIGPDRIDAVLLTHLHPDHCLDVCGLYVARKYAPPERTPAGLLPVWGPEGVAERIFEAYHVPGRGAVADTSEPEVRLTDRFDFRTWSERTPVRIGPFTVEPHIADHPVLAYSFRITGPDGAVLAYSGDTDECEGLDAASAGADLLLIEAAFVEGRDSVRGVHLTGRRAGATAERAGARRLLLTHITPWDEPARAAEDAAEAYRGPIDVAVPGARHEVTPAL